MDTHRSDSQTDRTDTDLTKTHTLKTGADRYVIRREDKRIDAHRPTYIHTSIGGRLTS